MSTRAELEASVAQAEADWRRARDGLDKAQAERAKANAAWDKVLSDRRKARTDRRKLGTAWEQTFPDRREAGSDRRIPESDIAAFSKRVADQHDAYLSRDKAEAAWTAAELRLNTASADREKAAAALDALTRAQRKT